jgi:DnaJ domain
MDGAQAFSILGLSPPASAQEIRSSYLDLVKVWHPDRFVNDPALQRKAQEKLKQINEAYRALTLSSPDSVDATKPADGHAPTSNTPRAEASSYAQPRSKVVGNDESRGRSAGAPPWVGAFVIFMVVVSLNVLRQSSSPTSTSPSLEYARLNQQARATEYPDRPPDSASSVRKAPNERQGSPPKRLSQPELDTEEQRSIESACALTKLAEGQAAYYRCFNRQLASLAASPRRPNLSSLGGDEQQSIESACALAKLTEGPAYYRCLNRQLASLAASPQRPNLSSLDGGERQLIASACALTKVTEGPARYNRCLVEQIRLLEALKAEHRRVRLP